MSGSISGVAMMGCTARSQPRQACCASVLPTLLTPHPYPWAGLLVAIISSVIFKTGYFQADNMLEPMLVILFAFTSYMVAEAFRLSGIVSILFCGMVSAVLCPHVHTPLWPGFDILVSADA